ncbi:hypothetical protein GWK47_007337 [Chionoecetes opilio]|uniref:Uncharacterized protein n=1 Tax=Chionoecetes opilio TaxID=41210 RepID=A0A8J4Y2D8_CHIOP|nr:hypothetical protein GWK47_007337 [Chionoecetes opilio]
MSFDTRHPTRRQRNGGLCPHRTEHGEKTAAFRLSSPYPGARVVNAVSSVFLGVPHPPDICSSKLPNLMERSWDERTSARESWWRITVATVLEDVKDELFDGLFKSFKSVRTFAMTTGNWSNRHSFSAVVPLPGDSIPCSWSNAQARWMSKVSTPSRFGCSGASSA